MFFFDSKNPPIKFAKNTDGFVSRQIALLFGAFGLAMTLLMIPQLEKASQHYAANKALNVDPVVTGTISGEASSTRIVTRSVLD